MTKQEIFDVVKWHLMTQNRQAKANRGCTMKSGKRYCAVGCLIPTELYQKAGTRKVNMFGSANEIRKLAREYKVKLPFTARADQLLNMLQHVHDSLDVSYGNGGNGGNGSNGPWGFPAEDFRSARALHGFASVAESFGLRDTPYETLQETCEYVK